MAHKSLLVTYYQTPKVVFWQGQRGGGGRMGWGQQGGGGLGQ